MIHNITQNKFENKKEMKNEPFKKTITLSFLSIGSRPDILE